MAEEPVTSSWHPALMPNFLPDPPTDEVLATSQSIFVGEVPESSAHASEIQDSPHAQDVGETGDGDACFPDETLNANRPGDAEPAAEELETSRYALADSEHEAIETGHEASAFDPPAHKHTARHSSSLSFARTVSHEVSFNDDDDTEWSLSRTNSDPFKSMAQPDRTNSFPVVPLMPVDTEHQDEVPLQPNQAMAVLEEAERDFDAEEEQYQGGYQQETQADEPGGPTSSDHGHAHSRSIGGDVPSFEIEALEARFEEGLPLISHASDRLNGQGDHEKGGFASFDDEDVDNDEGFFSQIHAAESEDGDDKTRQSLQRKSTMQVLASIDSASPSQQAKWEGISEDEDEEEQAEVAEQKTDLDVGDKPSEAGAAIKDDLASKWQEAFASENDDADFLLGDAANENKDVDAAAFLGSDDEGLLDDDDDDDNEPALASQPTTAPHSRPPSGSQHVTHSYFPSQQHTSVHPPIVSQPPNPYSAVGQLAHRGPPPQYGQPPVPRLEVSKAESFADKSRGGYSSPYDLPTDLIAHTVKPRKRASMQQLPREPAAQSSPSPRSASMNAPAPPPPSAAAPSAHHKPPVPAPAPAARAHESFFEDLPVTTKLRPGSRQTNRAPSPGVFVPPGPSPLSTPMTTHPPHVAAAAPTSAPVPDLVGPERVNPYATLQTQLPPALPPTGSASRYSPAPTQLATGPPVVTTRYSTAPPASRPPSSYNPAISAAAVQPVHAHLPRTSSPLAHFEMNSGKTHVAGHDLNGDAAHPHEMRATRVPSLPTTREVDEEEDLTAGSRKESLTRSPPAPPTISRYSPVPTGARRTPPPPVASGQSMLSPPQRPGSSYVSHAPPPAQPGFAPPARAQTQSPGASRGGRHASKSSDPGRLPASSSQASALPAAAKSATATHAHPRPPLPTANMVAPTDGREHDPLQRWRGAPIVCWGVGGSMVTSFPKSIPRYVMNQTTPSILRAAGEVKVRNIKDIEPLPERVAKFPGPLKGKSKKKEVLAWLSAGIESLEKELPGTTAFQSPATTTEEAKRAVERLLLWKVLHVLIEFDGVLEGTPAVEKAVRDILSPGTTAEDVASQDGGITFGVGAHPATVTSMQPDGVDAGAMEQIRRDLLRGDHETAVWAAVDKRLWGHAMLISRTVSPELYKRVAQEFVRKEVNHAGHSNESLAALYKILSGNYDDCVDELVPVHARAGLQLVSTESSLGPARTAGDGLEKWRETLTLVLSNRSADDVRGLNALGKLLSGYGRAEAAHICFIFSRSISVFGGLDDPNVDYVLLGSDHRRSALHLAQDTEALQLTEVYEYGLSLSGAAAGGSPHLTAYKLHHIIKLAEYGHRDKALQYCDAITTAMSSQTRRSPYHHSVLEATVMDVMRRLKQAPKEESASWMSKPSMNKVSDSMWNRFNKFVAGDEQEGDGTAGEGENGPFARIATPTMSRSPSVSNLESFGMTSPSYPTPSSRYAPQASRNSSEYHSNPYEPAYPGVGSPASSGGYVPAGVGSPSSSGGGYVPAGVGSSFGYQSLDAGVNLGIVPGVPPMAHVQQDTSQVQPDPPSYGVEARETHAVSDNGEANQKEEKEGLGYEPPSLQPYGYEPPSYEPGEPLDADGDVANAAPKKKSFMDDDDDDIPGLKPQEKSKAEKDRENEEMFRKAAEEDAKRAAASSAKKGWGFGWFGGNSKKETAEQAAGKPIKAKLGEASSFVYDPDLRRWINKKPGAENVEVKAATPPPPRGGAARGDAPRSVSGTPPGRDFTPPPPPGRASVPPMMNSGLLSPPALKRATSQEAFQEGSHEGSLERLAGPPAMTRSVSASTSGPASRPPSRPTTSVSNASSIDDLLGTGPRKGGQKKRKGGRYVDVMAK